MQLERNAALRDKSAECLTVEGVRGHDQRERRRNDRFSGSSTQTRSTTRPVVVVVAVYLWLCATATAVARIADTQPRKSSKFILAAETAVVESCQVSSMGLRSSEQLSLRCCLQRMQSRPQQSVEDELDANTLWICIIGTVTGQPVTWSCH